jgi:ribosomal protein S18 acetylase RimI-like enzyme
MRPVFTFGPFRERDFQIIKEMLLDNLQESVGVPREVLTRARQRWPHHILPRIRRKVMHGIAAMDGKQVAGILVYSHTPTGTVVNELIVSEAYQGQGLSGQLLSALAKELTGKTETFLLHSTNTNLRASGIYQNRYASKGLLKIGPEFHDQEMGWRTTYVADVAKWAARAAPSP